MPFMDQMLDRLFERGWYCLIAQHDVVDLRQSVRLGQVGATGRQTGTVVVIVTAKALLQAAHSVFGLTM